MPNTPIGVVNKIDNTATAKIILPSLIPNANGIPASAACTVAFGRYAIIQKIRSLIVKFENAVDKNTANALKNNPIIIAINPLTPAEIIIFKSTFIPI